MKRLTRNVKIAVHIVTDDTMVKNKGPFVRTHLARESETVQLPSYRLTHLLNSKEALARHMEKGELGVSVFHSGRP